MLNVSFRLTIPFFVSGVSDIHLKGSSLETGHRAKYREDDGGKLSKRIRISLMVETLFLWVAGGG